MARTSRSTGSLLLAGVALSFALAFAAWSVWLAAAGQQLRERSAATHAQLSELESLRDTLEAAEQTLARWDSTPAGREPEIQQWRRLRKRMIAELAIVGDSQELGARLTADLAALEQAVQRLQDFAADDAPDDSPPDSRMSVAEARAEIHAAMQTVARASTIVLANQGAISAELNTRWNELWILAAVAIATAIILGVLLLFARREADQYRAAESALLAAQEEIGDRVREQTAHLRLTNAKLHDEIAQRRLAQDESRQREERLKRQNAVLVELSRSDRIAGGDLPAALREIAQAAAETLAVERVGIWLFDEGRGRIECVELFQRHDGQHQQGKALTAADYPEYFKALEAGRTVAAHSAMTDPRTAEFTESYLKPLGISSMLDAIVRLGELSVGVVCHEHVGPERNWSVEEQAFAGSIADFVALALQASERRKVEHSLQRQRAFLRQVIDTTPHMIFAKDREGRFTLVNEAVAEAYGSTVANITGKKDEDFNPNPEEVAHFRKDDLEVMNSRREKHIAEEVITDNRGHVRWLATVKRPIIDESGVANQVLGVATDITAMRETAAKLRQLNQELHRKNRELEEYASIAAHDLKRPAVALHGLLSLIREDAGEAIDAESRENLELALRECERMEHLIAELSSLSRAERLPLTVVRAPLEEVLQRCVARFQHQAAARDVVLSVSCDEGVVHVSRRHVEEALANLVENALVHGCPKAGCEVRVTGTLNGATARVSVADNGPGIGPEEQRAVFELFQRGSQSDATPGTGVGLFAVTRLMSQIGGRVELQSQPGRGAMFTLVFPVQPTSASPPSATGAARREGSAA